MSQTLSEAKEFDKLAGRAKEIGGLNNSTGTIDSMLDDTQNGEVIRESLSTFSEKCNYPLGNHAASGDKMAAGVAWDALNDAITAAKTVDSPAVVNVIEQELQEPFVNECQRQFESHPRDHAPSAYK